MGVKSYVAGLKREAADSFVNAATQGSALYAAKVQTDVVRETVKIESDLNSWFEDLKNDRNYEGYEDRQEEKFNDLLSTIDENEHLGSLAKHKLKNEVIPKYKESIKGSVTTLKQDAMYTQIEIDREGHADLLVASDKTLDESKTAYKSYLDNLNIYNDGHKQILMKEFEYVAAPQKVLQDLQTDYQANYLDSDYSVADFIGEKVNKVEVGEEAASNGKVNLDPNQYKALLKNATAYKADYDEEINKQTKIIFDQITGDLDEKEYNGEPADISDYEEFFASIPDRFGSNKTLIKNKIHKINDSIISREINEIVSKRIPPSDEDWGLIEGIYNPVEKDKAIEGLLTTAGNLFIYDNSITDLKDYIFESGGEQATYANKQKAYAAVLKEYAEAETDTKKIANLLVSGGTAARGISSAELGSIGTGYTSGAKKESKQIEVSDDGKVQVVSTDTKSKQNLISDKTGKDLKVSPEVASIVQKGIEKYTAENGSEEIIEHKEDDKIFLLSSKVDGKESSEEEVVENFKETGESLASGLTLPDAEVVKEVLKGANLLTQSQEVEPEPEVVPEPVVEKADQYFDSNLYKEINKGLILDVSSQTEEETKDPVAETEEETGADGLVIVSEKDGTPTTFQMPDLSGKTTLELIEIFVEIAKEGNAKFITSAELDLIPDKEDRDIVTAFLSDPDQLIKPEPRAMLELWNARLNKAISPSALTNLASDLHDSGAITLEYAEKLSKHSPVVNLENWENVEKLIYDHLVEAFPDNNSIRTELLPEIFAGVERAVLINNDLIDDDYFKLQGMVKRFVGKELAAEEAKKMKSLLKILKKGDMKNILKATVNQDLNTFMDQALEGKFDLFLRYPMLNEVDTKILRSPDGDMIKSHTIALDAMTKELTHYESYDDLKKNGTDFQKTMVLANSNYLFAAGVYEKALYGSYGLKAADVALIDNRWAFKDPENPDIWFYPAYSEVQKEDKINWGLMKVDEDRNVVKKVLIRRAVDPKTVYDIEDLKQKKADAEQRLAKAIAENEAKQPKEDDEYIYTTMYGLPTKIPKDSPYLKTTPSEQAGNKSPLRQQSLIDGYDKQIKILEEEFTKTILNRKYLLED